MSFVVVLPTFLFLCDATPPTTEHPPKQTVSQLAPAAHPEHWLYTGDASRDNPNGEPIDKISTTLPWKRDLFLRFARSSPPGQRAPAVKLRQPLKDTARHRALQHPIGSLRQGVMRASQGMGGGVSSLHQRAAILQHHNQPVQHTLPGMIGVVPLDPETVVHPAGAGRFDMYSANQVDWLSGFANIGGF